MFGRLVTIKLRVNSAGELARINKQTIVPLLHEQKGSRTEGIQGRESIYRSLGLGSDCQKFLGYEGGR